ncbi:hypothetical protein RF11_16292 [Thelohanellus kitauei]|uniref:Uncharacterized protein n=1 Tax=Thelohanellus kitauei TaxID=669202 RepID=A0A0C2JH82_THEKT|nr:hypothetical protein RF11_16292 [Thelohanellus kitauei]
MDSCRKSIEVCLENVNNDHFQRWILPAHQRCVYSGYIFEKEFEDVVKSKEFYNLADKLCPDFDITHRCSFTPDFMVDFVNNCGLCVKTVMIETIDYIKKTYDTFTAELCRTTDSSNKFYAELKKEIIEEIERIKNDN